MGHSDPAVLGGAPVRTRPFPRWPESGEPERAAIARTLDAGQWNGIHPPGRAALEHAFARFHGATFGISTPGGTAAIELGLTAMGVGIGDEVIVQPYTCVADVIAILRAGGVPVFADIDIRTACLDVQRVRAAVTPRTKAILAIHYAGRFADMEPLAEVAGSCGAAMVEDACLATGAAWQGRSAGTFAPLGCFSLGCSEKMVTCGEGGMVITRDADLADLCRSLGSGGWAPDARDIDKLGWSFRMSEVCAALALAQLERYPDQLARRNRAGPILAGKLDHIEGVCPVLRDPRQDVHPYSLFLFRIVPERWGLSKQDVVRAIHAEGIPVSGGYEQPLYKNTLFQDPAAFRRWAPAGRACDPVPAYRDVCCPAAERACYHEMVWLRNEVLLGTDDDLEDVVRAVEKAWSARTRIRDAQPDAT